MTRSANSTIKGFLYQFEKTLNAILSAEDDGCEITVEGIEDIDIDTTGVQQLIQCKYHELQENYTLSKIEKPVLQMLKHWGSGSQDNNLSYILFCYFNNSDEKTIRLKKANIQNFLNKDAPKDLLKLKDDIRTLIAKQGDLFIDSFLQRFVIEFGEKYETLVLKNIDLLKTKKFNNELVDEVIYPNAIAKIHNLSIQRDINDRKTSPFAFYNYLRQIDTTILFKYTMFLKNYKQILTAKRRYLKINLNSNFRKRYFVYSQDGFDNFENEMICFINEYLDNFQYKRSKLHINEKSIPTFILECDFRSFENIHNGLKAKNINANVGFVFHLKHWDEHNFFKPPITDNKKELFEFRVRLMYINQSILTNRIEAIRRYSPEDLFIINTNLMNELEINGTQKEIVNVNNIKELKYILNMVDAYE